MIIHKYEDKQPPMDGSPFLALGRWYWEGMYSLDLADPLDW